MKKWGLLGALCLLASTTEVLAQGIEGASRTDREMVLLNRIEQLEKRLAALETRVGANFTEPVIPNPPTPPKVALNAPAAVQPDNAATLSLLPDTTLNVNLDGYYGFNFNRPVGRVSLLRSNDVHGNNFTVNQAGVILERAADPAKGRRFGGRLDLMFGQNTETLQGSYANEPRPQVYRNIFQAYGTYVAPIGSGLTLDFGKFASSLGFEGNYVKDQLNYSRSFYFNYLPFYHTGLRASYKFNENFSMQYWLINGANQSEGFNNSKSNAFILTIQPAKQISWNVNYFFGQQGRDVVPADPTAFPTLPTQSGLSTTPTAIQPTGREHIFDTYATWNATKLLTLVAEGDYVVNRETAHSAPAHVIGGAAYARYQFTPAFGLSGRFEYLSDRGGLFSGTSQALKETTATATYQIANGFQIRGEVRRDFTNIPFFLTHRQGGLKKEQNTATVGLVWWFGGKQGSW